MTNDECIEVAEKVWGWESLEEYDKWGSPGDDVPIGMHWSIDAIEREIESWSGFGRTVEAMAGKDQYQFAVDTRVLLEAFIVGAIPKEELWERTHLAALEAIKNNSK